MCILSYSSVLSPPAIPSSRVCAVARSKEMQVAANALSGRAASAPVSYKGVGIAAKLNIDKNSIDVLEYIETDACGNYVINARPGPVCDHARWYKYFQYEKLARAIKIFRGTFRFLLTLRNVTLQKNIESDAK